ncbi:hypothetical protein GCM10007231_13960 [Nocardioides daphniae]|uniref:Uncharacterized protein n=1 Tax=Nocardioides daphniae TaxID=402297 RepID=A0ABQ1Q6E0_9ACTN|nr:hypothetical protein GCM10007231_13960 [Nocardioides daphniae]
MTRRPAKSDSETCSPVSEVRVKAGAVSPAARRLLTEVSWGRRGGGRSGRARGEATAPVEGVLAPAACPVAATDRLVTCRGDQ